MSPFYAQYILDSSGLSCPVESLLPNAAGLFDMHGNAWEWVQNPTSGSMSPVRNDSKRLLHGGAFSSHSSSLRSTNRVDNRPVARTDNYGFRPTRTCHLLLDLRNH